MIKYNLYTIYIEICFRSNISSLYLLSLLI